MQTISGTFTTNSDSNEFIYETNSATAKGIWIHCNGEFDGGIVSAHYFAHDKQWRPLALGNFTEDFDAECNIPNSTRIRLTMAEATAPDVYFEIAALDRRGDI